MTEQPEITRYVGFYLIEGFWADMKPDYSSFNSRYWVKPGFWKLMDEEVVRFPHGDAKIVVYRDGMIAYTDDELSNPRGGERFERIEKYSEILNAVFAVFVSTFTQATNIRFHENFEVTHHHIIPLTYQDGVQNGMGIPQKSITATQIDKRLLANVPSGYEDSLDNWIDPRQRAIIPKKIIEEACRVFFAIAKDKQSVRTLARSNKAAAEYASTSFSDCVLISWIQVEIYLHTKLEQYMTQRGTTKFNKKRRDNLQKGTSAQIIELLEIGGVLSREVYDLSTSVRKVRNEIVHKNHSATVAEAGDALRLLEHTIEESSGEVVKLNLGISMHLF